MTKKWGPEVPKSGVRSPRFHQKTLKLAFICGSSNPLTPTSIFGHQSLFLRRGFFVCKLDLTPPQMSMDLHNTTDPEGRQASPVLANGVKNFLIDIDGTVCEDVPNEEPDRMIDCAHFPDALETCNRWYDEGHVITFFTSRTEDLRSVTESWLIGRGFKYHGLLMNKPRGGNYHWIDNHLVRATRFEGRFTDLVKATKSIEVFREDLSDESPAGC